MQNNWKLSKDILNILGTIYNRFEFDGMLLERISDKDIKDLQNVDGLEDILIDTENGKRVHPILETSFLTVTDSTHRISILFSGDGTSVSVSMRGNLIAVTEKTNDSIEITWVPFINLAIGAACSFLRTNLTKGVLVITEEENGVVLQGILAESLDNPDTYNLEWTDFSENSRNDAFPQETVSGEEAENHINSFLAKAHSHCLQGVSK